MPNLMDLPTELRLEIYHHALVRPEPIDAYNMWIDPSQFDAWHTSDAGKNLLLANHQVNAEAHPILYRENLFRYPFHIDDGEELAYYMPPENIALIRNLCIEMQNFGGHYFSGNLPDPELWSPVLGRLTRLVIVAKQPLVRRSGDVNGPSEFELSQWIRWCGSVFNFVAAQIKRPLIVEIDDGGKKETRKLVEKYFEGRWRKVRTVRGDELFRRGKFAKQRNAHLPDHSDDEG